MSIIIRLQNLPLPAKSGDIRRFFGGLRIPNGGVHIIGGEKGDAFIVFNSDEDARLAMRKDGQRILDARVKLHLSSHMEMQHEIGKITKLIPDIPRQQSPVGRQRSSRSPPVERNTLHDRNGKYGSHSSARGRADYTSHTRCSPLLRIRSRSPRRSPKRLSTSPRRLSRSPRRSRSPKRFESSKRFRSPRRSRSPRRLSRSPIIPAQRSRSPVIHKSSLHARYMSPVRKDTRDLNFGNEIDTRSYKDDNLLKLKKIFGLERTPKDVFDWQSDELSRQKEQALFEQKIAEALAIELSSIAKAQNTYNSLKVDHHSPLSKQTTRKNELFGNLSSNMIPYKSGLHDMNIHDGNHLLMSNILSSSNRNITESFVPSTRSVQHAMSAPHASSNELPMLDPSISMANLSPSLPMSIISSTNTPMPPALVTAASRSPRQLVVTLSGLKPGWDFRIVQDMLKGTFVTKKNIVFCTKVGTVYVKFCNRSDYKSILEHSSYYYKKRVITVSECSESVYDKLFPYKPIKGLYYIRIKGLPYDVVPEKVLSFFEGLEVADLYIVYAKYSKGYIIEGKAVGIAFVAFGNRKDYKASFLKNGEMFGNTNRTIHLMQTNKHAMTLTKQKNKDLLSQSETFIPADIPNGLSLSDLPEKRPLCTLVTGLPQNVTRHSVVNFFKDKGSNPSFIYLPLDKQRKNSSGRSFIAFDTLLDFDAACQCHGTKMGDNVICVKQILHDEMLKCLPEFERHQHIIKLQKQAAMTSKPKFSMENHYKRADNELEFRSGRSEFLGFENEKTSKESFLFSGTHPDTRNTSSSYGDNFYYKSLSLSPEPPFKNKDIKMRKEGRADLEDKVQQTFYKSTKVKEAMHAEARFESEMHTNSKKASAQNTFGSSSKVGIKKKPSRGSHNEPPTLSSQPSAVRNSRSRSKGSEPISREKSPNTDFRKSSRTNFGSRNKFRAQRNDERIEEDKWNTSPRSVRMISPQRSSFDHANYSNFDPYSHEEMHSKYQEAVVQICNVDPVIGSPELMDFFTGFDIDIDKIVRRVTDRGEPTGDVRVTFENRKDAEQAVKILNGSFINGVQVDMFLVT